MDHTTILIPAPELRPAPPVFVLKQGDTGRPYLVNLGFDLAGCAVALLGILNARTKINLRAATVLTPGDPLPDGGVVAVGDLQYDPIAGDVDTAGMMRISCIVTLPSTKEVTVPASDDPNEAYFFWEIQPR
jgi:hypothetical protein